MSVTKDAPTVVGRKAPHGNTRSILRALGVPFKLRYSFWFANRDELPYIYHDFHVKAKQVKRELHPDTPETGNVEEFKTFSAACDLVERQFRIRGIGSQLNAVAREAEALERKARQRAIQQARHISNRHGCRIKDAHAAEKKRRAEKRCQILFPSLDLTSRDRRRIA